MLLVLYLCQMELVQLFSHFDIFSHFAILFDLILSGTECLGIH